MAEQQVNIEMLKEMVMYITEKCKMKDTFAYTHLNKILHYSDMFWYGEHGSSISGETYIKQKFGPISKHIKIVERLLKKDGFMDVKAIPFWNREQKKPISLKSYPYRLLTEQQKQHLNKFIDWLGNKTAAELREYAKTDLSYSILDKGSEIPYDSVYFLKQTKKEDITEDDLKWANEVIEEYEKSLE